MTTEPHTLDLDDTIRDAIVLMQTGRYRNVPLVDRGRAPRRRRPPVGHHQVPGGVLPGRAAQPPAAAAPAHEGSRRRMTTTKAPELARRPGARASHHPVRGRFRRRDAAHRHAVHPDRRGLRQRHQHAARLPGRDPRAGRLTARRVRASRSASRRRRSTRPGDQPDVLVAMNPAALKTNIGDLPAGGALIVNSDAFTPGEPEQGGVRQQSADATARSRPSPCSRSPSRPSTTRSLDGLEMTSKQKDLTKNFFALGPDVLAVRAEHGPDPRTGSTEVRRPPGRRGGEQAGAQGRLRLRRDDRGVPHPLPRQAGQARTRASTGTSPGTRPPRSGS